MDELHLTFEDTKKNPYICGQCGHICKSVNDQFSHFSSTHPDILQQIRDITGIGGSPDEVIEKFEGHRQVINFDSITLLHKLQRYIAATHIAVDFNLKNSTPNCINPELNNFYFHVLAELEQDLINYPLATELLCNLADGYRLYGALPESADFWVRAAEIELRTGSKVFNNNTKNNMNQTFVFLGDVANAHYAQEFPNVGKKTLGLFGGNPHQKDNVQIDDWLQRKSLYAIKKGVEEQEPQEPFFRAILARFSYIAGVHQTVMNGFMTGQLDEDDFDFDSYYLLDDEVLSLKSSITQCNALPKSTRDYWEAHLQTYYAYRMARRSEYDEGHRALDLASTLFANLASQPDHPNELTNRLVSVYANGNSYNSVLVKLHKAGLFLQEEKDNEANETYMDAIDLARNTDDPNSLIIALDKTAESMRFNNNEQALSLWQEAEELEMGIVGNLNSAISNGNLRLLKLKDNLAMMERMVGNTEKADELDAEIAPYADHITWRQSFNIFESDDEE